MKSKDGKVVDLEAKREQKENNQIQLTNGQLRNIMMLKIYSALMMPADPTRLSGKAKTKLMKLSMRITPIMQMSIEKVLNELREKYGKKDKEGKLILNPPQAVIDTYCKKDKNGKQIKGKDGQPILELPKDYVKQGWEYDFGTKENQEAFEKEAQEMLDQDAEVPGERITLDAEEDIFKDFGPLELGLLTPLINFEE